MGSRRTVTGSERVYASADIWVERALRSDDSLFTPGTPIWSSQWLSELRDRFLDSADEGQGSFYDELKTQLQDALTLDSEAEPSRADASHEGSGYQCRP